jgi:MscS family membrane protein
MSVHGWADGRRNIMTEREPCGRRRRPTWLAVLWIAVCWPLAVAAPAEPPSAPGAAEGAGPGAREVAAAEPELSRLGPGVPRGAVREYLEACREGDFARAARRLDLRSIAEPDRDELGAELARKLEIVLDRKLWVEYETLSADPEGHVDDGLPPGVDRVGAIAMPSGDVAVLLQRVALPDGERVWKIASSTVERIPALYEAHGYGLLGDVLPPAFFEIRYLEIELWQWIGLLLIAGLALALASVLTWTIHRALRPVVRRTRTDLDDRLVELVTSPVRVAIALLLFSLATLALRLSVPVHASLSGIEKGLAIVVATWILMRIVHVAADVISGRLRSEGRTSVVAMMPLGRKTVKVILVLMAFIALLQNLGFNVTGIVAGLGVGGLAVALAAQKTVENLFGGVTLAVDQPVRVGDFCRFGDRVGTVEDIGLRSTRVRTLDRTLVTVANSEFSQLQLENFAKRDRIRLHAVLGLRYETTPDQLRWVLAELRRMLAAHPRVHPDPARVRFVGFGEHSLDLEVFAYVPTQDYDEFLKVREDIFLRTMDIVEQAGTAFAFPSQITYAARDAGLDRERGGRAEAAVRTWREEGKLPFPDFSPEMVSEVEDSLDYPPRGSLSATRAT